MAEAETRDRETRNLLGANERLVKKLHPHQFSFFGYYGPGILLFIWSGALVYLLYMGPLKDFEDWEWFGKAANPLMPMLIWFAVAILIGLTSVRRYHNAFMIVFTIALILGLVVAGLMIWMWDMVDNMPPFTVAYSLLIALLAILSAELYRRAFSYYITNFRIIIRYKLFSTKETNIRFEKIEDWKIVRPLTWRLMRVGTIRPYTGTEDGKYDANLSFDAPDECLYGVKRPDRVKQLLVDLMLERDVIGKPEVKEVPAPEKAEEEGEFEIEPVTPAPEPEAPPEEAAADEEEGVVYYKPAPAPEPTPEKNFERLEVPGAQPAPAVPEEPGEVEGPVAYPEPDEDEAEPRTMFPEARETGAEPRLEDLQEMSFERPRGETPEKKRRKPVWEPDDDTYDESKPRSL
jgi:hypothetical protein